MNHRAALITGILFAGLAVATGAFGAHALKDLLEANQRSDTFELAVRYQFYHAFGLIATGLLLQRADVRLYSYAGSCFATGIIFFSGSLYLLSFTGITAFGAVTPIGGILFIAGWIFLLIGVIKSRQD